jgi:hypothetical protein
MGIPQDQRQRPKPHQHRTLRLPVYDHKSKTDTFWNRTPVSTISITDPKERQRIISRRWNRDTL